MESNTNQDLQKKTFTPLSAVHHAKKMGPKFMLMLGGTALLAITALVLFVVNIQQRQTLNSGASLTPPSCYDGTFPLPVHPTCYQCKDGGPAFVQSVNGSCPDGSQIVYGFNTKGREYACSRCPGEAPTSLGDNNWTSCPAPDEGFLKKKGSQCYEGRFKTGGLGLICTCQDTTPTPPSVCEKPFECLPPELCVPDSSSSDTASSQTPGKCANGQLCCVRKQPTPSISSCPVPAAVVNVKISCPTCD